MLVERLNESVCGTDSDKSSILRKVEQRAVGGSELDAMRQSKSAFLGIRHDGPQASVVGHGGSPFLDTTYPDGARPW